VEREFHRTQLRRGCQCYGPWDDDKPPANNHRYVESLVWGCVRGTWLHHGVLPIRGPVSLPLLGAGAGAGAHHGAPHPVGRRYEILSSNFRLASKKLDGYDAWASQVCGGIFSWVYGCLRAFAPGHTSAPSRVQSDKKILHGSVAIITVEDGEVAVVRNVGKRQTLGPGRYRLEVPQQVRHRVPRSVLCAACVQHVCPSCGFCALYFARACVRACAVPWCDAPYAWCADCARGVV
jgi:hypothetical protein